MILSLLIATAVASLVVIVKLTLQLAVQRERLNAALKTMDLLPKAYEQTIKQSFPETHQQMYDNGKLRQEYGRQVGTYLLKSVLSSE